MARLSLRRRLGVSGCLAGALLRLSYWDRLSKHSTTNARFQTLYSDHVHTASKQSFKFCLQTAKIQEGPSGLHLDQEIYVALFVCLAACHGAKNPHITRPVLGRHA